NQLKKYKFKQSVDLLIILRHFWSRKPSEGNLHLFREVTVSGGKRNDCEQKHIVTVCFVIIGQIQPLSKLELIEATTGK
ncbi:hypothetical protein P5673_009037, partial [Acropora cervicornis]